MFESCKCIDAFVCANRSLLMITLAILAVVAQMFVILHFPRSSRYCEQPLLNLQVASIVFTALTVGRPLKLLFKLSFSFNFNIIGRHLVCNFPLNYIF